MEQGFQQNQQLRQEMKLSPQMVQSLKVLQAPLPELHDLIQAELSQNPVLEEAPGELSPLPELSVGSDAPPPDDVDRENDFDSEDYIQAIDQYEAMVASGEGEGIPAPAAPDAESRRQYFMDSLTEPPSLTAFLEEQLMEADLDEKGNRAGQYIIGNIDENGWLSVPPDEIAREADVSVPIVEKVLKVIQGFDPPGIAAKDWCEAVLLQLERLGYGGDSLPIGLVRHHITELSRHSAEQLVEETGHPLEEIERAMHLIASLDPRPGLQFSPDRIVYVVPEVSIFKTAEGGYTAELLRDTWPQLNIRADYENMAKDPAVKADVRKYLAGHLRSGRGLMDSLAQRRQTVLSIAQEIARTQHDFFERGLAGMVPLRMADVAEAVGLHETTVSRAVAGKYAQTPQGLLELRFFFMQGLVTADGGNVTTGAVKEAVGRLIRQEDVRHPLSDQDIADKLKGQGIQVARRTVAKYREQLGYPPSHLRK